MLQQLGEVTQAGTIILVQVGPDVRQARRAASCLLVPLRGDKVLLAQDQLADGRNGTTYVLAVLERTAAQPATLDLPGDTEIKTSGGRLNFCARDGIGLQTSSDVSILSTQLNVSAVQGEFMVDSLSFTGRLVRGCIDSIKLVGRNFDAVLERYYQRATRSYRHIEEIDQVKASHMHYEAKNTLSMHSRHTLITADELVKVDAEQIHMGYRTCLPIHRWAV